jgi:O-antigen ligase
MEGQLQLGGVAPIEARSAGLSHAADRWGRLASLAALAFVANLYASPAFYWPETFERWRLGLLTSAVCAGAVLMRRVTGGERLRLGGPAAGFLFAYAAVSPLSFVWTIDADRTADAVSDMAKLAVLYVALLNALDTPARLRRFLLVGSLATLGPSIGAIQRWLDNDQLVEGYRTAWRGNYADPNRLAMGLVLMLPPTIACLVEARRPWLKALLLVAGVANVAAMVLTHSRSGAVALAAALALSLLRGRFKGRGLVAVAIMLAAMAVLAPKTFWTRSSSITEYEHDVSFEGRERAWQLLLVIMEVRPLTGVGAGAFLSAWNRFAPLSASGRHLIAHNLFMEIMGELGAVALLLFAVWSGWLLVQLWHAGRDPTAGIDARALFAGLAGYLVCELVNGYSRSFNLYAAFACAVAAIAHASARARLAHDGGAG